MYIQCYSFFLSQWKVESAYKMVNDETRNFIVVFTHQQFYFCNIIVKGPWISCCKNAIAFLNQNIKNWIVSLNALETYISVESKHIYCSLYVYVWYFIHSAKKKIEILHMLYIIYSTSLSSKDISTTSSS